MMCTLMKSQMRAGAKAKQRVKSSAMCATRVTQGRRNSVTVSGEPERALSAVGLYRGAGKAREKGEGLEERKPKGWTE